jgi:4-hydroxy-2-oxoglutarate aldolase
MGSTHNAKGRPFPPDIHVPCLTWFLDGLTQEIDWDLQKRHIEFLVSSGLDGSTFPQPHFPPQAAHGLTLTVVVAGTNGEAVALTSEEKSQLIRTTRETAARLGRPDLTITAGTTGQCTRAVAADARRAHEAGADFALALVPSYFHAAMTADAVAAFFEELADESPLPVVIYNFPAAAAGLDVDSDGLARLGRHANIVGVKLTCGGVAKAARVRALFGPRDFCAVAGQSDWLVPALVVGGVGVITGVANLYPKVSRQTKRLCFSCLDLKLVEGVPGANG